MANRFQNWYSQAEAILEYCRHSIDW